MARRQSTFDDDFDHYHKWLGIPENQRPPTFYQLLGVSPDEWDLEVIRVSAKKQEDCVRKFTVGPYKKLADSLLYELQEASVTLLNPKAREKYDSKLSLTYQRQAKNGRRFWHSLAGGGAVSVGEGSQLTRHFLGIMSVILLGFIIMAVISFRLHWIRVPWDRSDSTEEVAEPQKAPARQKNQLVVAPPAKPQDKNDGKGQEKANGDPEAKKPKNVEIAKVEEKPPEKKLPPVAPPSEARPEPAPKKTRPAEPPPEDDPGAPPRAVAPFDAATARKHQENWAKYSGTDVEIVNSIGMKLVLIPPGEFLMGSPDSDRDVWPHEKPQHKVRITKPYFLGKHEVTQAEWKLVMGSEKKTEGTDFPMSPISWHEANDFCKRLSNKEGRTYRLPTEAEWEYACRAGTSTIYWYPDNEKYPWGTRFGSAEIKSPMVERPSPLGAGSVKEALVGIEYPCRRVKLIGRVPKSASVALCRIESPLECLFLVSIDDRFPMMRLDGVGKPDLRIAALHSIHGANPFGIYNMEGKVFEWCSDWFHDKYYSDSPINDPPGPMSGTWRVYRGEGWNKGNNDCRSASRHYASPDLGFKPIYMRQFTTQPEYYIGGHRLGMRLAVSLVDNQEIP